MANGSTRPHRIDTHHHIVPPAYLAAEREKILGAAIGRNQGVIDWTPDNDAKLVCTYGPSARIAKLVADGEEHDVAIVTAEGIEQLTAQGRIVAGTRSDIEIGRAHV